MLKMMNLREIVVKEHIQYIPGIWKRRMRYVLSMYRSLDGGIVLLFAYAICAIVVIKGTEFGLLIFFGRDHILKSGHKWESGATTSIGVIVK
jgi:hypothetical protein